MKKKTRAYLTYGLGEIILVVIGILIALQINNWNETRKDKARLKAYYHQLLDELESDISAIKFSLARLENDKKAYKELQQSFKTVNLPTDTLVKLYKKSAYLIDNTPFNTKTIEVLKATGDVKLLPAKIKNALVALENEQQDHEKDRMGRADFYISHLKRIDFLSPFTNLNYWKNHTQVAKTVKIEEAILKELPLMDKALSARNMSNTYDIMELTNILNMTTEVKRFIQDALNASL